MFNQENIQVPVLGVIENMAYFTPEELPNNKYYIFGKQGAENLATDKNVPFLGALPLVQSVREAADVGRPAALQEGTPIQRSMVEVTQNLVTQLLKRNTSLPPTKAVAITNMVGCAAIK
jgi:ATP-binding protein involved in chromosome partitioning